MVAEGRLRQRIVLRDGRCVTARAVLDHMAGTLSIDDYALRQDSEDRFTLAVTPEVAAAAGEPRALHRVRELLGDVDIRIEVVRLHRGVEKTHVVTRA